MPDPLVCPDCRSVVTVPAGYTEPRIHCAICWSELTIPAGRPPAPSPPPPPPPAKFVGSLPDLLIAAPLPAGGRSADGMAPLEALIARAAARSTAPKPKPAAVPPPPPPPPVKPPSAPVVVMPAVMPAIVRAKPVSAVRPPSIPDAEIVSAPPPPKPAAAPYPPVPDVPVLKKAPRPSAFDDDTDDDAPRRVRVPARPSNAPIVLAVGGGLLALVVVAVGGFLAYRLLGPGVSNPFASEPVADVGKPDRPQPDRPKPPAPPPDLNPPPVPAPDPPAGPQPIDWQEVFGADGYTAKLPPRPRAVPATEVLHENNRIHVARGRRHLAADGLFQFEISSLDLPAGADPDVARLARLPGVGPAAVRAVKVGGFDGFASDRPDDPTLVETRQAVRVGAKVFVLTARLVIHNGRTKADAAAARDAFFAGFKVTADPDARPVDPWPFDGPAPKLTARLDPFLAAVVFPNRGELFTVGLRPGSRTQGVLRRYTYPGFVPKNTYHLPAAGTYMVGSEADGRLALATVGKAAEAPDRETERWAVTGDVQVFDLAEVFAGTVNERDELKPAASILVGSKIAGLELLADGRSAALLALTPSANKARPWRPKLVKLDLAAGKAVTELELPDPAWRLRRSAAGDRLYAAEVPLGPTGVPLLNVSRVANVLVVDAAGWKLERTRTTPGPAFDLAAGPDGGLVAAVAQPNGEYKAYTVPADGQTAELGRDGRPLALGHLGLTPDGRRLVTTAASGQGFAVYELKPDAPPRQVQTGRTGRGLNPAEPPVPLGGAFELSPDGRYALLHAGPVLEVGR